MTFHNFLKKKAIFAQIAPATLAMLVCAPCVSAQQADNQPGAGELKITREQTDRFKEETRLVLSYMASRHYGDRTLDQIDPGEMIEAYMKDLDYAKLFFVKADVDAMNQRFDASLKSDYLTKGNLYPAFEIFSLYRQRANDRLAWIFERLKKDFDFTTNDTYRPDRKDAQWPANQLEADKLWECRLKYEMLDGMLNGESVDVTRDKLIHRYQRTQRALGEMEAYDVEEVFLNSFTTLFDPHSNFMSVESAENFTIHMSNSLEGIGAMLFSEDGYCVVGELVPGGPAELCGQVNPGDKIVAVAQGADDPVDVVDMKLDKVVKMIRGPKGSEVRLTIVPANNPSSRSVVRIIRDEVRLTEQLAKAWLVQVPSGDGATIPVGVIALPSFYGGSPGDGPDAPSTTCDVQELLIKLKSRGAQAIVLDLRRNGGGLLSEAIRLTGLFIKDGPVVQVRYDNGRVQADFDDDGGLCIYEGPLIVLVSRNSASASEICVGALQTLHRAVVVGDKTTHGKGTVQQTMPLSSIRQFLNPFASNQQLGMLKITVQKFYLPDGSSTQERGVISDVAIPSINEFLPIGETDLEHYLPWDSIAPAVWDKSAVIAPSGVLVTQPLLNTLEKKSADRQASMPEFDYQHQLIARFKEIDDRKDVSVNESVRRKEKTEEKAFREKMDDWLDSMKADGSYPREEVELSLTERKNAKHQQQLHEGVLPNGRPRANNYYQKVYYYEDAKGDIHTVNVEKFNFESALRKSADVAAAMSTSMGREVKVETATEVLRRFRNSDPGSDFNVEGTFKEFMPELSDADLNKLLPDFFKELVRIAPDVLDEDERFDIDQREAVRVASDWIGTSCDKALADSAAK